MKIVVVFLVTALAALSHCQQDCCRVQSQFKKFGPGIGGNPVTVDVGSCAGSCTDVSKVTITDGTIDYFVGPEPASPSQEFAESPILDERPLVGFDKFPVDRWFAHTVRLPPKGCRNLAKITVKICLNASSSTLTTTDSFFFYDTRREDILYASKLSSSWRPGSSGCKTVNFGPAHGVFQYAETNGFYHIAVQDDTGVDYIQTTLSYASWKWKRCRPSLWTHVDVPLATGIEKVDKIIGCECQRLDLSRCRRQPKKIVFFQNSMFEREIDVGYCVGSCRLIPFVPLPADNVRDVVVMSEGNFSALQRAQAVVLEDVEIIPFPQKPLFCQPASKRRVDITGPYGPECVEIITNCSCTPQCYRMPYFKHFVETIDGDTCFPAERIRTFNVGKCAGTCDEEAGSDDVMNLGNKDCPVKCTPRGYKYSPRFLTRDGSYVSVPMITTCDCKRI